MPTCSTFPLRSPHISGRLRNTAKLEKSTLWTRGCRARWASTATAQVQQKPIHPGSKSDVTPSHHRTLTALHKTTRFLPRVLPSTPGVLKPGTLEFWEELLSEARNGLNQPAKESSAKVVGVYFLLFIVAYILTLKIGSSRI